MKKALVTGATGFVGSFVCRELVNHGYSVRILHRAGSSFAKIEGLKVEKYVGELTDKESLLRACEGIDIVFHIGAIYREAKFGDEVYWKVNFEGTKDLLEMDTWDSLSL